MAAVGKKIYPQAPMNIFINDFNSRLSLNRGRGRRHQSLRNQGPSVNGRLPSLLYLSGNELYSSESWSQTTESIPLVFRGTSAYVRVMCSNIVAEYVHSVKSAYLDAKRGFEDHYQWHNFTRVKDNHFDGYKMYVASVNFDSESWSQCIVEVEGYDELCLVTYAKAHEMVIKGLRDEIPSSGKVRMLTYVGSYILQYSCASTLAATTNTPLLDMILNPAIQVGRSLRSQTYVMASHCDLDTETVPINNDQAEAVIGLRPGLDVIQGPPGTGKSTTIWHIINTRLKPAAQCLVTCTRNQAVNAIATKIESFGVLVFGNEDRLGEDAKRNTIDGRLNRDQEVLYWLRVLKEVNSYKSYLEYFHEHLWKRKVARYKGLDTLKRNSKETTEGKNGSQLWSIALKRVLLENAKKRVPKLTKIINKWEQFLSLVDYELLGITKCNLQLRKKHILQNTKVYLSTIDATSRMTMVLSDNNIQLNLDSCIVDEAGCVLESAIPVLLRFNPNNLVLIGDHKQLQPFSAVKPERNLVNMTQCRSLMERAVLCGLKPWFLSIQYRMHPDICKVVSKNFYDGRLTTGETVDRKSKLPKTLKWLNSSTVGSETVHNKRGYSNLGEAALLVVAVKEILKIHPEFQINIITFYNKQRKVIAELIENENKDLMRNVLVLSIDACQGSEADVVLLSTVRTTSVGPFMQDMRRLCVALSRAKYSCYIVGHLSVLRNSGRIWEDVADAYNRNQ